MAIVLGTQESCVHGEGPQLIRCLKVLLHRMVSPVKSGQGRWNGNGGKVPDRRSPCAVKAARTVTTEGMRRRVERYRALSLSTAPFPVCSMPLKGTVRHEASCQDAVLG